VEAERDAALRRQLAHGLARLSSNVVIALAAVSSWMSI
jgi:hypothetical protein